MPQTAEQKRAWYVANRERHLANSRKRLHLKRDEIRAFVADNLVGRSCIDCGEGDPVVLDFDHIGEKAFNISEAVNRLTPLPLIAEEMAKCEVRCANCHRRKTHRTFGYRPKVAKP